MARCTSNDQTVTHRVVTTTTGTLVWQHDAQDSAESEAQRANADAAKLGLSTRYEVQAV